MICSTTSYSEIESLAKAEMLWHSFYFIEMEM